MILKNRLVVGLMGLIVLAASGSHASAQTEPWVKVPGVAQYKGAVLDSRGTWDNQRGSRRSNLTLEQARAVAEADPNVNYFVQCNSGMYLETMGAQGNINAQDAMFFSGSPWYGSAPQCDAYERREARSRKLTCGGSELTIHTRYVNNRFVQVMSLAVSDAEFTKFSGLPVTITASATNPTAPDDSDILTKLKQCLNLAETEFVFLTADRTQAESKANDDVATAINAARAKTTPVTPALALPATAHHHIPSSANGASVVTFQFVEALQYGPTLHEFMHRWANYAIDTWSWDDQRGPFPVGKGNCTECGHWGISNAGGQLGGYTALMPNALSEVRMPSAFVACDQANGQYTCPLGGTLSCDGAGYATWKARTDPNKGSFDRFLGGSPALISAWVTSQDTATPLPPYCYRAGFKSQFLCQGTECPDVNQLKTKRFLKSGSSPNSIVAETGDVTRTEDFKIGADYTRPNGGFAYGQSINNKPFSAIELYYMGLNDTFPPLTVWSGITYFNASTGAFKASTSQTISADPSPTKPAKLSLNPFGHHLFKIMPIVVTTRPATFATDRLASFIDQFAWFGSPEDRGLMLGETRMFNLWEATGKRAYAILGGRPEYQIGVAADATAP